MTRQLVEARGRHRFYADTALFGAPHAVRCVIDFFGPEHVLFGTDTPLGPSHAIDATIADVAAAGLSEAELAAVYAGNAHRLLGVRWPQGWDRRHKVSRPVPTAGLPRPSAAAGFTESRGGTK